MHPATGNFSASSNDPAIKCKHLRLPYTEVVARLGISSAPSASVYFVDQGGMSHATWTNIASETIVLAG